MFLLIMMIVLFEPVRKSRLLFLKICNLVARGCCFCLSVGYNVYKNIPYKVILIFWFWGSAMIDSQKVLYSGGKNDECYTPGYGVKPIVKYIPKNAVVWCPFDTTESEFVKQISENGNKVVATHISKGQDFYEYEPRERWDVIVSNPPFTNKRKIFERALSFNKPFALMFPVTWLNDAAPKEIFIKPGKQMQMLLFDMRIKFSNNGIVQNKITFSSGYLCWNFLPKDIVCERLKKG